MAAKSLCFTFSRLLALLCVHVHVCVHAYMNYVASVLYMLHIHSSLSKLIPDNVYHENHPALPYRTAQQPGVANHAFYVTHCLTILTQYLCHFDYITMCCIILIPMASVFTLSV